MQRSLPLVVPAMLACIAGPAPAQSEIEITGVVSLANQPQLSEPMLVRSRDALHLRIAAGFANPCLAAQGIGARHLDLGHLHLVVALPAGGAACPELWRPTRSCLEIELPGDARAIALLEAGSMREHPLVLEVESAASLPPDPACRQQPAAPLLDGAVLPLVLGAEVAQQRVAPAPGYTLELNLLLPGACPSAPLHAQILESRVVAGAPTIDWLVIHSDPCPPGEPVARRATLRQGLPHAAPRKVAILNPVQGDVPALFPRIIDVLP
jgi:hypothetical protein